jgi:hypothetical protein
LKPVVPEEISGHAVLVMSSEATTNTPKFKFKLAEIVIIYMKGTYLRLLTGIILPAPVGTFLLMVYLLIIGQGDSKEFIPAYFGTLHFAYFLTGIQSIVFSLLMEFVVIRKNMQVYKVFIVGGLLGMLGDPGLYVKYSFVSFFTPIGFLTGSIVALILHRMYIKKWPK